MTIFHDSKWRNCCLVALAGIIVALGSCQSSSSTAVEEEDGLEGRILVWHGWDEEEAPVLDSMVNAFERIHPRVTVVVSSIPAAELRSRFETTAVLGLGPDLMLGSSDWALPLAENNIIEPISPDQFDSGRFNQTALDLLRIDERIYGIPLTIEAPALYYNQELAERVPRTYEELLAEVEDGQTAALSTRAYPAFMGIQAFGKSLLQRPNTEESGLVAWLEWLQAAQDSPNIILSQDEEALARLFMEGQVTFYIASIRERERFREALAEGESSRLGIAPLPSGPIGLSRPLIKAEVLFLNSASSNRQRELALALADFLTNAEQNNTLLRDLERVPANQRVRVNSRVYPSVFPFVQASRAAVALPQNLESVITGQRGDAVYTAVLSGVKEPEIAVCELWQFILQETEGTEPNLDECASGEGE